MRHRRSLAAAAAALTIAAGSVILAPTAAADQPTLQCAGDGFMCSSPGHFGTLTASYTDAQPAPSTVWGAPKIGILDSPADALDVEPGSEVTRSYGIEIPWQTDPSAPRTVSMLVRNNEGLFANPADMRFHVTDAAGADLPDGTCTPEEQNLNPGEQTTVTCTVPDGGALLKAYRRGDFGGEYLAAWALDSQTPPSPPAAEAPGTPPVVAVDGRTVTGAVEDGVWKATAPVTRRAPDANGAEATHAPEVTVDGTAAEAPSFRITTRAAAPEPKPTPTATATPEPSGSPGASAAPTTASQDPAVPDPGPTTTPGAQDPGRLPKTGAETAGALGTALLLTAAGALVLGRLRRRA